jgi:biopolymer transport protein ExbD
MALKKRRPKRHLLELGLNITSLIDVLTVLIFFLLKSMTVTSVVISPPADLVIPRTASDTPLEDSVSVSLSNQELRMNNEVVVKLTDGQFDKTDFDSDRRTLKNLKTLLDKAAQEKRQPAADELPTKIIIQADKDLPFHTIQFLLHTAALSGFTDYQFVVAPK